MLSKPKVLTDWESAYRERPRVCWNCEHLDKDAKVCLLHSAEPPTSFAETDRACVDWLSGIPF